MEEELNFNWDLLRTLDKDHGFNDGREKDGDGTGKSDAPYHPDYITHCKWMILREPNTPEPCFEDIKSIDYAPAVGTRLIDRYREFGLQVIVKMTSIELTPENPEFSAKEWEIAGQANEQICASAMYCLESHNISNPVIQFRAETDAEFDSEDFYIGQGEGYEFLGQIYGTQLHMGSCIQSYGNVEMRTGRLLAFPNIL